MCGRYTQKLTWAQIHALYRLPEQASSLNLEPRYNGCPTQHFAACRLDEDSTRTVAKLRWGLLPTWARDRKMAARLINARAETVHEKPAFRAAFRRRRCLVPADGWLEWRSEGGVKQPYYISAASGAPVSFAGLWERWEGADEAAGDLRHRNHRGVACARRPPPPPARHRRCARLGRVARAGHGGSSGCSRSRAARPRAPSSAGRSRAA